MRDIKISANQLATFSEGSEAKKKSVLRQQKKPNPVIVARYATARARMRKSYVGKGDLTPIIQGIEDLKKRIPDTDWKRNDKVVSIEALTRFLKMKLPDVLIDVPYEIVKRPKVSYVMISDVKVIVSPDIIVRIKIDGQSYLGAIKIRIAKSGSFTTKQSKKLATLIHKYLDEIVAREDDKVHREMCLAIDVFNDSTISAPMKLAPTIIELEKTCDEIKSLWSVA